MESIQDLKKKYEEEIASYEQCVNSPHYTNGHKSVLQASLNIYKKVIVDLQALEHLPQSDVTDKDIESWVNQHPYYGSCTTEYYEGLGEGAKWMRDEILKPKQ